MILSILGLGLTGLVFQEIKFASTYQRLVLSLPVARAALKTVFLERQNDLTPAYDTLAELTLPSNGVLCGNNSYKYYFADLGVSGQEEVVDEGALLNINLASLEMLEKLPGLNEDLAKSIVDSGLRPFKSINEVLLVEGISEENFILFKDMVTVYGNGKVNLNTANKPVLLALGMDEELADAVLRFRKEHKIEPAKDSPVTEPEYGIDNLSTLAADLAEFVSLGLRQEQSLLGLFTWLDVKSEYLRFNIIPKFGGASGVRYSITIHPATNKVISWREY
jgi:DNA uptake protein ComE-like DNA-binding protein